MRSPSWLADVDISTVICVLHGSEEEDLGENLLVQDDLDISFISLNCDDDDSSSSSWDSLCRVLPAFLSSFTEALERGGNVLICDPTGFSSSVALLSIFLLLKFQTRIETTEELCVKARPCVYLSLSHRRGLRAAQARLDQLQMKRMNSKLRTSSVVSLAF